MNTRRRARYAVLHGTLLRSLMAAMGCAGALYPMGIEPLLAAQQTTATPSSNNAGGNSNEMTIRDETSTAKEAEAAQFRVNVRLVLARVVVRDAEGHTVGNLHKEDFEVLDNGKPQVISNFTVEHTGAKESVVPVGAGAPSPSVKPAEAVSFPSRYLAYLFDDVHLSFNDIVPIRVAAEHRLNALAPTDRVAILTTSGQGTVDFTDDRAKLGDALRGLKPRPVGATEAAPCPDISYYMADLIENKHDPIAEQVAEADYLSCDPSAAMMTPTARAAMIAMKAREALSAGEYESRVATDALRNAVRRISLMPGQRSIVLASPGFLTPGLELHFNEMIDRALRAQVIISTIDARGLYAIVPGGDASQEPMPSTSVAGQYAALKMQSAEAEAEILSTLASGTGGVYFHNNNDMNEGFRRAAGAAEYYYVLGFTPQEFKSDGKFHTLKIKLKSSKKYDLQARRGYYAPSHEADAAEEAKREIDDEVFSIEQLHDLPVELHTQFFKSSEDMAKLTVLAHVDVKRLSYKQAQARSQNTLTVVTAIFDPNGNLLQSNQKTLEMRWKDETLQRLGAGVTLRSTFDVRSGRYMVRLVTRDAQQQLMSAENGSIEIP